MNTIDSKLKKRQIILSNMKKGVYIEPLVWVKITSEMNNTAIACFADREYEKNDYIHNLNEFKKIIKK